MDVKPSASACTPAGAGIKCTKLYITDASALEDTALYERVSSFIPYRLMSGVYKYKQNADRRRALAVRALLIYMLKEEGINAGQLSFTYAEYGKPVFSGDEKLYFSFSHSGTWALCALSDMPVGCDVEKTVRGNMLIAQKAFCEEETEALKTCEDFDTEFCRIWTARESYMKCTGLGFLCPRDSFSAVNKESVRQKDDDCRYELYTYENIENYICSLCVKNDKSFRPDIKLTTLSIKEICSGI
ncbi:MAG: 4'-phosphopantetheinyl transferase superfamily protein [Clostridia bacterium]|nr:4'-phosphopantetheinyl transferase superfamily protein [Clostridia bacterium]